MGGGSDDLADARRALHECTRQGRRVSMTSTRRGSRRDTMIATIEQVRETDFIIDRPMVGAHVRPLAINEPLRISFVANGGHCSGLTKPLSRYRFASGGASDGRVLYGYRMAIPDELEVSNRRQSNRVSIEHSTPVHVSLHPPGVSEPMKAVILDISAGGMRLRLDDDVLLIDGQELLLTAELPPPGGSVAEPVQMVRVERCVRTAQPIVAVRFAQDVPSVARYVRQLEIQRARRAGAA